MEERDKKAKETSLWAWLRDGVKGFGKLHIQRVENLVRVGVPDVEFAWAAVTAWVELKTVERARKLRIKISPEQVQWLRRRWECGGRCYVLVQVGSGDGASLYLVRGINSHWLQAPLSETSLEDLSVLLSAPHTTAPGDVLQAIREDK